MTLIIGIHAHQRLGARRLSLIDVERCIADGTVEVQANGRRHYSQAVDNGMSVVHVITTAEADILVTAWISGRLDLGV